MPPTNILLVHCDQHRFDCVGVNGHPLIQTPHMDRIAAEGVNFTHAFTPCPLCVPERNSLLHGQWNTQHQCIANFDTEAPRPPAEDLPTYVQPFRDAGYFMGYVAKWHVNKARGPLDYGFHEYVPEGQYGKWRADQGLPPRPRENRWFGEPDPHITPEQSKLAWSAGHAVRMMEQCAAAEQPFFIRWDPTEPHLANVVPEPYNSMYPPETIEPWPSYPDPFEGKPYIQAQQLRTWKLDQWTWDDWAPVVSRYLGEISLIDAQVGRMLAALDRLGLAHDTLVIYTTDHGDMCGGHGMIDKHFILYDDVVRVPLMMRWPGRIPAGHVCPAFVPHAVDLATTFLDVAGLPVPDTFKGQSLLPLMEGGCDNGRPDIFSMYHGNQFGLFTQRMVRDRRWKYVWNATAEDELYDLESDPGELRNLATAPDRRAELARLRARLVAWMEEVDDCALNTWTRVQISEALKV